MNAPKTDVLARIPLADAVLTLWSWATHSDFLDGVFEQHRGRCYEKHLSFPTIVALTRDALLECGGSGKKSFHNAKDRGDLDVSFRAVYGKLGRLPIAVSQAFLAGCAARLEKVYPQSPQAQTPLPSSLDDYEVLVLDGKAIKRVAKRLKPLRTAAGGLLGGRALVAMKMRSGLAIAMHADPDGDANEVRFVGDLVPKVRHLTPGRRRLWVADSAFSDLTQPARFAEQGDAFLIRHHPKVPFYPDPERPGCAGVNDRGQRYLEEWGWLGSPRNPKRRIYVRRITVYREGQDDVSLLTNLCDPVAVPAADLMTVYLNRWGIERMFQQVTEVFGLEHLIGTRPRGVIFQFAMCLSLYNQIQVVRGIVATGAGRPREEVSGEKLFEDVQRQLIGWSVTVTAEETVARFAGKWTAERVRARLSELLSGLWTDRWLKSPAKKPRTGPKPVKKRTHGSVYRILEAHQRRLREERRQVQTT